jgi:CheY-like chemotaxis protein
VPPAVREPGGPELARAGRLGANGHGSRTASASNGRYRAAGERREATGLDTGPGPGVGPGVGPSGARREVPRVVHVSGDPATRTMVTTTLRRMFGADTVTVPRAALAMEAVRRAAPALVLIDGELPDATPSDLLAVLTTDPGTQSVPALVLAVEDDPRERLRLRQAGAVDVVRAPLEAAVLAQAAAGRLVAQPAQPTPPPSTPASPPGERGPAGATR